jgi:glycosyltransferase involved in cell wall biosynthesis
VSVVVPVFNEEGNVGPLAAEIEAALADLGCPFETVFVDDGSTDGTLTVLREVAAANPRVRVVALRTNVGKATALSAGFGEARGEVVVTLDGDLQDDPGEVPKLLRAIAAGYDLANGWKWPRHDPRSKTWPSRLFNAVVRRASGVPLHDFNCGIKAYRAAVTHELVLYGELHRYIPVLASQRGFRVTEVQVRHRPRRAGRSKYGPERLLRGLFDLVTVSFLARYGRRPLHLFGGAGLACFGAGFAILSYLTALWFSGQGIGHRPLLSLGVLMVILGMQWTTFGLLAEMLTFEANRSPRERPIRETFGQGLSRGDAATPLRG